MTRSISLAMVFGLVACGSSDSSGGPPAPTDSTGSLRAITAQQGAGTDATGFSVLLDGVSIGTLTDRDTVVVEDLSPGQHSVALGDLATNCYGTNLSRNTSIAVGTVRTESFQPICFLPLSNRILMDAQGGIHWIAPAGGLLTPLATTTEPVESPVASPDGALFAYVRYLTGQRRLAVARADGTDIHDIVMSCVRFPAWNPSGTQIAFSSFSCDSTGNGDIRVVASGGGTVTSLTETPDLNEEHPSWSPDGSQIVFYVSGSGGGLFRMDAVGGDTTRITSDDSDRDPVWAPSGQRIAFVRGLNPNRAIWLVNADGSDPVPITGGSALDGSPTWSPDGQQLAFTRGGGPQSIRIVDTTGTNDHAIISNIFVGDLHWAR